MVVFSWDRDIFFGNPEDDEPEDQPEMDGLYLYDGEEDGDFYASYFITDEEDFYLSGLDDLDDQEPYEPYGSIDPLDYSHYMY